MLQKSHSQPPKMVLKKPYKSWDFSYPTGVSSPGIGKKVDPGDVGIGGRELERNHPIFPVSLKQIKG